MVSCILRLDVLHTIGFPSGINRDLGLQLNNVLMMQLTGDKLGNR